MSTDNPTPDKQNQKPSPDKSESQWQIQNRKLSEVFWGTLYVLIFLSLSASLIAYFNGKDALRNKNIVNYQSPGLTQETPIEVLKAAECLPRELELEPATLARISQQAGETAYEKVISYSNDLVQDLFQPVYDAVPKYLDAHYSILGQYAELKDAVQKKLEEKIREQLLGKDWDDRFSKVYEKSGRQFDTEYLSRFEFAIREEKQRKQHDIIEQYPCLKELERGISWGDLSDKAVEDAKARIAKTGSILFIGKTASGVTVLSAAIAQKIGAKITAKVGAKIAVKGGSVAVGAAAGAATGALSCAPLGPFAIACAVGGAAAAWIVTDLAVVTLDEYLNRDEFEAELRQEIDNQKAEISKLRRDRIQKGKENVTFTLQELTNQHQGG